MRPGQFFAALAAVQAWTCTSVIAQPDQQKVIQAWFDQAWAEAQRFPDLEGYSFSWTVEQYSTLTAEDVARLRREVEGHPEHPDRLTLEAIDRSRGGQVASQQFTLWADRRGQWRYNSTNPQRPDEYFDKALTNGDAWMLTPGVLNIVDPSREPPPGKDIKTDEHVFLPEVGLLLNGGLTSGWLASLEAGMVRASESGWTVEATLRDPVRGDIIFAMEYSGRWDAEHSRGFVDQARITRSAAEGGVGETQRIRDWHVDPVMNRWVARSADTFTPQGVLERSIRFVAAEPVDGGMLSSLLAVPESGRNDAVRGSVRLARINDWKSGTFTDLKANGTTTAPLDGAYTISHRDRWQLFGWVLGASLVTGLIGLALRKRMAHG
jgi:hypothetical protein